MTDSIEGEMMDQSVARLQSGFSARIDAALGFSAAAHHEDVRKGTQIPYVMHPFHVGLILDRHGFPEDVVIAGILHDTLEDPDYGACGVRERLRLVCPELRAAPPAKGDFMKAVEAYLQSKFGEDVHKAVGHVTERKYDEQGGKRAWKVRRVEQLDELASASPHACAVKSADCLHNLRSMIRDIESDGAESMRRFNGQARKRLARTAGRIVAYAGGDAESGAIAAAMKASHFMSYSMMKMRGPDGKARRKR